jgi:ABC-type Zn uptake system ZnuABC Zn-binding protein ZnuA
LIRVIREQNVRAILAEPFSDEKVVELVARDSGIRALALPSAVGGAKGVETYVDLFEHNVRRLAEVLR